MPEITDQSPANQTLESINSGFRHQLRVRVCGICVKNNTILLVKHHGIMPGQDFWSPPGGGLNFGETVHNCLKREFMEETGLEIKSGRFLFVNEFLQPPLHALELFFETEITGGALQSGSDPEYEVADQLIREVAFLNLAQVNAIPFAHKHRILHELVNFDDIFIPQHHFIK